MSKKLLAPLAAVAATLLALLSACSPAPTEPKSDVGIQLFQWSWEAVAAECEDYLGPAGISWVLLSPAQEHITGEQWWTAYQPVSYQIESRLGTRDQFQDMVERCGAAGVDIVADVVINHMTGTGQAGEGWAGSSYEHYEYPGIYSDAAGDFHHCGANQHDDVQDYQDAFQVQFCELVNLADLATEKDSVRATITAYLQDLLDLGVAGFRVDAAKHMPAEDIAAILDPLPEDIFVVQEVIRGAAEPITPEQYIDNGLVHEFGWAREVEAMTRAGSLTGVLTLGPGAGLLEGEDAVIFVTNHDTERDNSTLSYTDAGRYAIANGLMLALDYGTPTLYSGYAFSQRDTGPPQDSAGRVLPASCVDGPSLAETAEGLADGTWVCEHRWAETKALLDWRIATADHEITDTWAKRGGIVLHRGGAGFAAFNVTRRDMVVDVETDLPDGAYCDLVSAAQLGATEQSADDQDVAASAGSCAGEVITVNDGKAEITIPALGMLAVTSN